MNLTLGHFTVIAAVTLATSFGATLILYAPPPEPPPSTDKVALLNKNFDELKSALSQLHPKLSSAFTASVQQERLEAKKAAERGGSDWKCQPTLDTARDQSKAERKAAGTFVQRAENKWAASKNQARGMDPADLPWGPTPEDFKAINDAIVRAKSLYSDVNSAQSSSGPARLAKMWEKARAYADKQPAKLPDVKAESLLPATVQVPCINETVSVH